MQKKTPEETKNLPINNKEMNCYFLSSHFLREPYDVAIVLRIEITPTTMYSGWRVRLFVYLMHFSNKTFRCKNQSLL